MKLSFCSLVRRPLVLLLVMLLPALIEGQQNLKVVVESLQATVELLQVQFEEKFNALQDKHDVLQDKHDMLQDKYNASEDKHDALQDKHDALQDKHDALAEEVSTFKKKERNLQELPFIYDNNNDTWNADSSLFVFPKGVIVGRKNEECVYGKGSFSVDGSGMNCPSGIASVTFGYSNIASGAASTATGGSNNIASGDVTSILGGLSNIANDDFASISGGEFNQASGYMASISGGKDNIVYGSYGSILGGYENVIEYGGNEDQWFKMIPPRSRGACEDDVNFEYAGDVKPADSPRNCTDYVGFKPNKRCSKIQPGTGEPGITLSFYCPKQCEPSCK